MNKNLYKKILSFLIIFSMVFTALPWQELEAWAYDADKYYVDNVTITKIYSDGGYSVTQTKVTIQGRYLQNISVGSMTSTGYKVLRNPNPNLDTVQEFLVDGDIVGNSIDIGNVSISIVQNELPTLLSIDKRSVKIGEEPLTLKGSYLSKIQGADFSAYYENQAGAGGQITLNKAYFTGDTVTIPAADLKGTAGLQNIVLKKETKENVNFGNDAGNKLVTVAIQNTYVKQFRLVDKIVAENLVMNPNRGQPGDTINFMATNGLDNYDVFFLKYLTDPFTNDNKGRNTSFTPNIDGKQVLTTQVPPYKLGAIENGEYFVILTNKIPEGKNPNDEVNKQMIIGTPPNYEKFTVIDASQKMKIIDIQQNYGPDTGAEREITGVFFGSLNIPEFIPSDASVKLVTTTDNETIMEIEYSGGTYKNIPVTSAKRTIKVLVGGIAKFAKNPDGIKYKYSFTDGMDRISIITPQVTDAETDPIKDVVVETETTFTLTGFPTNVVIRDRAEKKKAYRYIPSKITPIVTSITPEKIHVNKINASEYEISEDRMVAINGDNFFVHKYTKADGTDVVRYPMVEIGSEIKLNKNTHPSLDVKVFDKNGREVDGSEGNEIGSKILLLIPKGTKINTLGKSYVKVTNPVRNADTEGMYHQKFDSVEFVYSVDPPVIESVEPDIITIDGNKDIIVTGRNFQEGVKVFLDGNEIKGVTREINLGANKMVLKFKAPPGRESTTQLQVMNPDGGIAIAPFTYVKTMNKDPIISNFSPNKGTHGTIVVLNGDNFLKPDPTVTNLSGIGIYRLIGTRVKLGDKEVNEYAKDGNIIKLQDYTAPNADQYQLIYNDNGKAKAANYYNSVVLQAVGGEFYTLDVDTKGNLVLSDGGSNTYQIIKPSGSGFEALKGNDTYTISFERGTPDRLKLEKSGEPDYYLSILTPYVMENMTVDGVTGNFITGHRVKIINKNQLIFTVPPMEVGRKWYDVTVINPDTKSSSRIGQQGFYYLKDPQKNPSILEINPPQGATGGGYYVDITGSDFEDDGVHKTEIYIGGVKVNPADVTVNSHGTGIQFKMPAYPGDLQKEVDTDRKTVPVVVVNPSDGGAASKEDGFTYVVPASGPTLDRMEPAKGSAAGSEIIQIYGSDFRYYEPYKDGSKDGKLNFKYDVGEEFVDLNGNGLWDNLEGKTISQLSEADKNILPKVFFGATPARILEYSKGYMVVETPPGKKGVVDVYIQNNDYGISNKVKFTYEGSNPVIGQLVPKEGRKQGKDKIEINGSGFVKSKVAIYNNQMDGDGNTLFDMREMTVVRFGEPKNPNISNREIPLNQANGGRIITDSITKLAVGNLEVEYKSTQTEKTVTLTINTGTKEQPKLYKKTIKGYDETIKYVSIDSLIHEDTNYDSYELIRLEVDKNAKKLIVERGYAPYNDKNSYKDTQLVFYSPSYYTIGKIPVTIINPDAGEAKAEFEYKNPESTPRITNMTKQGRPPVVEDGARILEMTYKGGTIVSIIGSDFRLNAKIQISDVAIIEPAKIEYDELPTKLTFTMPAVAEGAIGKPHRVVVINEDGGIASSDEASPPIYIKFIKGETSPAIEAITPNKGPAKGGTKVTIRGKDFRRQIDGKGLIVYFGEAEVPSNHIQVVDDRTITVITPAHAPGKVVVKVENPDGELSNVGEFTYLSSPKVIAVVDPLDPNENSRIRQISVEGQQTIKLKGSGFIQGARVVFAPVMIPIKDEASAKGTVVYLEGEPYDLQEGKDGTEVLFIDGETLTVKTPAGKLDSTGIVVVNPDKGVSNIYEDIKYGLPELAAPGGVTAELVYDRYIKVNWSPVTGAREYEVYLVTNNSNRELIGSTALTSFVFMDIRPRTSYTFVVKAVGDFGASAPSNQSNTVTTGSTAGPGDEDGALDENTKLQKVGDKAIVQIGTKDARDKQLIIDLTKGDLAGSKEAVISIPAWVIARGDAKDITVNGKDFRIKLNPSAFYSTKINDNRNKADAGVKLTISPRGSISTASGETALSNPYQLKAELYIGKDITALEHLKSSIMVTLDVNTALTSLRSFKTVNLSRYDGYEQTWLSLASGNQDSSAITALTDQLGQLVIIGRRR